MRGAWIEISDLLEPLHTFKSLPMRGAWIEIQIGMPSNDEEEVAPHAGSVD